MPSWFEVPGPKVRVRLASTLLRAAIAGVMVFSIVGYSPFTQSGSVSTADAKALEWGDVRPPLTDESDSSDGDGFTPLERYGNVLHAVVVAPNGDVFTAGNPGDIDGDGSGDCDDDASDVDLNGNGTCDAESPVIYRSTDGGTKWRQATVAGAGAGAQVRKIVVSPDWPSDDFIAVVFSTNMLTDGEAATDTNGLCWSTDAGLSFPGGQCVLGSGADPDVDNVILRTVAVSPDFNWNDGNGEVAMGGYWVEDDGTATDGSTTMRANTTSLKNGAGAGTFNAIGQATMANSADDVTLDLSYTYDEEPISLARLYVLDDTTTYGQVLSGTTWNATADGGADEISDNSGVDLAATSGNVLFDNEYATGGVFFAAAGRAGTDMGGVFRFSGSNWNERTLGDSDCDTAIESFSLSGNGSSTRMVASVSGSNVVCRSSNEGSSWSDSDADGGDGVCDQCGISAAGALTRVAMNRSTPAQVYWTTSGDLGGISKSTNSGSAFADTGLTNQLYVVQSVRERSATEAFAIVMDEETELNAIFWTGTYGTGAGWQRVLRTSRTDLSLSLPSDFGTSGTVWARFTEATTDQVIRSTDGGRTWDNVGADPFEDSPESNETCEQANARTATTFYCGGSKGHVAYTTNGGSTWTLLAKDFGEDIDEFDFTTDATTFFVTGEDTDSVNKVWITRDSGALFTQVGNAPWGTGDGDITLLATGYKSSDNTGTLLVMTTGDTTTDEVYRLKIGDSTWTELELDVAWTSALSAPIADVGDGVMLVLWDNAGDELQYSVMPLTADPDTFDPDQSAGNERDNPLMELPAPPVTTGLMRTGITASGYTLQSIADGRIMELTLTAAITRAIQATSPAENTSAVANIGDEGIPMIFRWTSIPGADQYDLLIGLDPDLTDGTLLGTGGGSDPLITTNLATVNQNRYPLVPGNTYYWRVRLAMAEGVALEGPWSNVLKFSVSSAGAPTKPEPQLPLENGTTANVGPIQFSFNLPAGAVQYQIQIVPLNNDGPGINRIVGDPALVSMGTYTAEPPVMGQGNYVLLPGATYTWRVRATNRTGAITETDAAWGPWSAIRLFKTPRPSAGTITPQVVGTNNVTSDTTPTLSWRDGNTANFYYELQLSKDATFDLDPSTATSFVFWNLVHGGVSTPVNSWTVPDGSALTPGVYHWRLRQRVQGTAEGPDEPGVAWSRTQRFTVQ